MIDQLLADPILVAAPLTVLFVVALRAYFGPTLLSLRFLEFWGAARRLGVPVIDTVLKRALGRGVAENHAHREEWVADFDQSPATLAERVEQGSERDFEVSILAGLKTDWEGNTESASIVAYDGALPWPGAPDFLRRDQVHVFMLELPDGGTRVCAHYEANSFRPDRWRDHLYKGPTFDAERGVRMVEDWLAS